MGRPRKDSDPPDSRLVAVRFPADLLQQVDEHSRRCRLNRSEALRDLVIRGLTASEAAIHRDRRGQACSWCDAPAGSPHLDECPHHPGSGLHRFFKAGVRRSRR